jgi:hypothetical protein
MPRSEAQRSGAGRIMKSLILAQFFAFLAQGSRRERSRASYPIEPILREVRQLTAARHLLLAVARASSGPLTDPKTEFAMEKRVSAMSDAVKRHFEHLAGRPAPDQVAQRLLRFQSYVAKRWDVDHNELPGAAYILWDDALSKRRLRKKLEQRAPELTGKPAWFGRLIKDALWEADTGDTILTPQRRRNWKDVREISRTVLPPTSEPDGERCTRQHFQDIADWIKENRDGNRNLPRTPETVGELFYLFCPCCVGMADPTLPGYAGRVQGHSSDVMEESSDWEEEAEEAVCGLTSEEEEMAEALFAVAPEHTQVLIRGCTTATDSLSVPDKAVLSYRLGILLVPQEARAEYPGLEEFFEKKDWIANTLKLTPKELAKECERMDRWFEGKRRELLNDLIRKLRQGPLPPKGTE